MENISGFGLTGQVTASKTFPNGFTVSAFADDADPLDAPDIDVADKAFGLNGHMVIWSRPTGIDIILSVLPNTDDERNLSALTEANRVALGKPGARDEVSIVLNYPNGDVAICSSGANLTGPVIQAIASSGRMKTRSYRFCFERVTRQNAVAAAA